MKPKLPKTWASETANTLVLFWALVTGWLFFSVSWEHVDSYAPLYGTFTAAVTATFVGAHGSKRVQNYHEAKYLEDPESFLDKESS